VRHTGSHVQLRHPTKPGRVTVAVHANRVINVKTLMFVLRQAALTADQSQDLLYSWDHGFGQGIAQGMSRDQVYTYTIELIPTVPNGYSAHVPALPGVVTEGGTVEEALAMAREAIALQLEGMREDGVDIPVEPTARRRRTMRIPIQVAA
jgi:antitoxin HicB